MADSDNNLALLMAFGAGVAVGRNWEKLEGQIGPYFEVAKVYLAQQKDRIWDILGEEGVKKTKARSKK